MEHFNREEAKTKSIAHFYAITAERKKRLYLLKPVSLNFLNAIEKMNRKRLKLLSFLNFLFAVDLTQLMSVFKKVVIKKK